MTNQNTPTKSKAERYCYIISIIVMIVGFAFIVAGIVINDFLSVTNDLYIFQARFPWRYLGLIIFAAGAVFMIVVLLLSAKKIDRVADRETRRKQRLSAMMSDANDKEEIFVTDGKITSSDKNEEVK